MGGLFGDLLGALIPGTSGLEKLTATLGAFFGAVTDGKMWRSLGWLVLGLVLMAAAGMWLARPVISRLEGQGGPR